jgi:very-short-patch-repair endonuclease
MRACAASDTAQISTHEVAYDEKRTHYLEARGYRVLRVQNHDVFTSLDDVLDGIVISLEA